MKSLTQSIKQFSDRRLYVERSSLNCRQSKTNLYSVVFFHLTGQVPVTLPLEPPFKSSSRVLYTTQLIGINKNVNCAHACLSCTSNDWRDVCLLRVPISLLSSKEYWIGITKDPIGNYAAGRFSVCTY